MVLLDEMHVTVHGQVQTTDEQMECLRALLARQLEAAALDIETLATTAIGVTIQVSVGR